MRSKCFGKELPPLSNLIQRKTFLLSVERLRYEFSASVLCRICKQRLIFPVKSRKIRDDKRRQRQSVHSFRSFIYSTYSGRLFVSCGLCSFKHSVSLNSRYGKLLWTSWHSPTLSKWSCLLCLVLYTWCLVFVWVSLITGRYINLAHGRQTTYHVCLWFP